MTKCISRLALLTVAGVLAAPATADMTLRITSGPGSGPGGEFRIEPLSGWSFDPVSLGELTDPFRYETFCVEREEYITLGHTYYATLNTGAVGGNGAGSGGFDPLSEQSAYLYSRFVTERLDGYDYGAGRAASADALQDVLWYLEDDIDKTWVDGDGSLQDVFYQDAVNNAAPGNFYNVRVLNLWEYVAASVVFRQDQLVMVPTPGATLLGLIGLTTTAWVRRRMP